MRFNEAKATQAAARLLERRGGRMSYMKLIKLLYLADREALARYGKTISTDTYFSMKLGPVLSQVLDLITEGPNPEIGDTYWTNHISEPEHYEVSLKAVPSGDLLSEAEDEVLDQIFDRYGQMSRWQLVDLVHTLKEWRNPDGGALPIPLADILAAQDKSPAEIREILEEISAADQVGLHLATR